MGRLQKNFYWPLGCISNIICATSEAQIKQICLYSQRFQCQHKWCRQDLILQDWHKLQTSKLGLVKNVRLKTWIFYVMSRYPKSCFSNITPVCICYCFKKYWVFVLTSQQDSKNFSYFLQNWH